MNTTASDSITVTTYFNECIISLVVALDSKGKFTWTICTNTQFHHLVVKASRVVLACYCQCTSVETAQTKRVGAYTHSNCLDRKSAVNTSDRRNPSTFSAKETQELYEGCGQTSSTEVGYLWS